MTAPVVTADRLTPYKEVARLLAEHRISGMPVLRAGWQVVGVVSEADLLAAQDQAPRAGPITAVRRIWRPRAPGHLGLSAGDLMTAPPVTIGPDATLAAAARPRKAGTRAAVSTALFALLPGVFLSRWAARRTLPTPTTLRSPARPPPGR